MDTVKKMLLISVIALFGPIALCTAELPSPDLKDNDGNIDRVAAIVNQEVITLSDVKKYIETTKQKMLMSGQNIPSDEVITKKVLDMMVNKKVQLQLARRNQIKVEVEEVNASMKRIADTNHITLDQLREALKKEGIPYKEFRKELKEQMVMQKLQEFSLAGKVIVTDEEASNLLQKMSTQTTDGSAELYHLANILITLPESPTSAQTRKAEEKAQAIIDQIHKGQDFSKVAVNQSDSDKALEGGDMGWRKIAEIPVVFATEVKSMKEGDVRGPLRAPNGFHIIKLLGAKSGGKLPTQEQVKSMIFQRKMGEQVNVWLQELREEAYVKIYI